MRNAFGQIAFGLAAIAQFVAFIVEGNDTHLLIGLLCLGISLLYEIRGDLAESKGER